MTLLKRKEVAAILGIRPQTLAKWAMTGKNLSVVRLGSRTVRYSRSEIDAFIERRTATLSRDNGNFNTEVETYTERCTATGDKITLNKKEYNDE